MNEPQATRRNWFQVSLKSLLILMAIVAAYFAGIATMMRRADEAVHAEETARKRAEAAEKRALLQAAKAQRQAATAKAEARDVLLSAYDQRTSAQARVQQLDAELGRLQNAKD